MNSAIRSWNRTVMRSLLLVIPLITGCAAFHPIEGVPARFLPDDFRSPYRTGRKTIKLDLLRQPPANSYKLDTGDVLGVFVEGVLGRREEIPPVNFPLTPDLPPSLGFPMPIREDGTISLPYIGSMYVRGLTVSQVEDRIRKALTLDREILQPGRDRILVSLQRQRQYRVLVIRQESASAPIQFAMAPINLGESKRGTGKVVHLPAYRNDVLNALAETGGLPGLDADNAIYIIRSNSRKGSLNQFDTGMPSASTSGVPDSSPALSGARPEAGPVPESPSPPAGNRLPPGNGYHSNPLPLPPAARRENPIRMWPATFRGQSPRGDDSIGSRTDPRRTLPEIPGGGVVPDRYTRGAKDQKELAGTYYYPDGRVIFADGYLPEKLAGPQYLLATGSDWQPLPEAYSAGNSGPHGGISPVGAHGGMPIPDPRFQSGISAPQMAPQMANPYQQYNGAQPMPSYQPSMGPPSPYQQSPYQYQYHAPAPSGLSHPMPDQSHSVDPHQAGVPNWQGPADPRFAGTSGDECQPAMPDFQGLADSVDLTVESPRVTRIPIRLAPGERVNITPKDITLEDGDIVFIEARDTEVFYTGGLLGGGQYTLPRDFDIDILNAIAIAQGRGGAGQAARQIGGTSALNNDVTISASNAIVLRQMPDGSQLAIKVDLYRAVRDPSERIFIRPGDYILTQFTRLEAVGAFLERHLLEGAIFGVVSTQLNRGGGGGN